MSRFTPSDPLRINGVEYTGYEPIAALVDAFERGPTHVRCQDPGMCVLTFPSQSDDIWRDALQTVGLEPSLWWCGADQTCLLYYVSYCYDRAGYLAGIAAHVLTERGIISEGGHSEVTYRGGPFHRRPAGDRELRVGSDTVRDMAENLTHWTHAKRFCADADLYELLVGYYTVGSSEREILAEKVFDSALDIVRGPRGWLNAKTREPVAAKEAKALPGYLLTKDARFLDKDADLSDIGYPPVWAGWALDDWRYIAPDKRDVGAAWEAVANACPGVVRRYIELVIVAELCGRYGKQERGQVVPQIVVRGVSESGKTASVHLAGAIADVLVGPITTARWAAEAKYQSYERVARAGRRIALIDEYEKTTASEAQMRNFVLRLQVGIEGEHGVIQNPPIVVFTGNKMPESLSNHPATSRRMIPVYTGAAVEVDWEISTGGSVQDWVARHPKEAAAIMSDLLDRCKAAFVLKVIAADLGYPYLRERETHAKFGEFRDLVFQHPPSDHQRWTSPSWRVINLKPGADDSPLAVLYKELRAVKGKKETDDPFSEVDWAQHFGVQGVVLDIEERGTFRALRFRHGEKLSKDARFNDGIRPSAAAA